MSVHPAGHTFRWLCRLDPDRADRPLSLNNPAIGSPSCSIVEAAFLLQPLLAQRNMLAKILAGSIVVLILLPFTAPFSTCDLATPLGHRGLQGVPLVPQAPANARRGRTRQQPQARAAGTHTPLLAESGPIVSAHDDRGEGRPLNGAASLGNAAVLVPARVMTERAKHSALMGPRLAYVGPASPASVTSIVDTRTPPQGPGALLTILRL
jgi:hypothetical protein